MEEEEEGEEKEEEEKEEVQKDKFQSTSYPSASELKPKTLFFRPSLLPSLPFIPANSPSA